MRLWLGSGDACHRSVVAASTEKRGAWQAVGFRLANRRPVPGAWAHAVSPCRRALPGLCRFVIFQLRPFIPDGRCSQGGVKLPTGGKGEQPKPASAFFTWTFPWEEGSADSVRFRGRRLKSG